jgi:hypothetical protein
MVSASDAEAVLARKRTRLRPRLRRKNTSLVLTVVALRDRKPNTVSNGLTGIKSEK